MFAYIHKHFTYITTRPQSGHTASRNAATAGVLVVEYLTVPLETHGPAGAAVDRGHPTWPVDVEG